MTRDTVESNRHWSRRLELPYDLLSDVDARLGRAWGVIRRVGIGEWKVEFFRRSTFLLDPRGVVAAVWPRVKLRGHVAEVLEAAKALSRASPSAPAG